MYNIIAIKLPDDKRLHPNYMRANANIRIEYQNEGFQSEEDSTFYLVTKDTLAEVIAKVEFESSPNTEDYKFSVVHPSLVGVPQPAKEWIEKQFSVMKQHQEFLKQFISGNSE